MCLLSQLVASKSNAGGYFCKGCAVVMEHTFLQVIEKMQFMEANTPAGEEKEVRVDFEEEIVKPLCTSALFLDYTLGSGTSVWMRCARRPREDFHRAYDNRGEISIPGRTGSQVVLTGQGTLWTKSFGIEEVFGGPQTLTRYEVLREELARLAARE